jgi:hypothetical protein
VVFVGLIQVLVVKTVALAVLREIPSDRSVSEGFIVEVRAGLRMANWKLPGTGTPSLMQA